MDGQVTWSDLGISCGKTWSEPSAATKEKTSRQSLKRSSKSSSRKPPVLKCLKRAGLPGGGTTMRWEDDGAWCGELTTRNTGERPSETAVQEMCSVWGPHSVAEGSRLSQILEETPHPKYNLTAKACQGILRRAERRGKDLPKLLKQVLLTQSGSGGGCDGGGKGALVQTEKSGTLGTGNDQTIFCLQGNGIDRADTAGCNGKGWREDACYTLNTIDRPAVCAEVKCMTPWEAQSARVYDQDGVWHSLNANENGGMARDSVLCFGFKAGQGAQAGGIGYSEEVSPTLAAAPSGTNQTPAVVAPAAMAFDTTQITSKENGSQPEFGKPCHSLNANAHVPCVALDMTHACDVIRECGEQVPALQARMGTGGNQVPLTYGIGNGQAHEGAAMTEEVSQTLNTMHDAQAVMCSSVDCRNFREGGEINGTLQAKESGGQSLNLNNTVRQNMVVRRLTPMECERLQGFPDGWTDIGDWVKTDKYGRKIKVKGSADSPRYKALGNSIALPFWEWMLRRMARYLPEGATLGSLFDGISGFNVCWARIHGAECCRWSSEIEQFPIAVVKKHFGDEEAGKEGDFEKFFGRNKKENV